MTALQSASVALGRARDVSTWPALVTENRGIRSKLWIEAPDGGRWLRKTPHPARPFELAIKALMLRLGQEAGLTAPDGHVCTWSTQGTQSRGIIVRLFLDSRREELSLGSVLLRERERTYDPESRWMQTLPRVRAALEAFGTPSLVADFARVLAFDGWIGNADRHQENWGVVTSTAGGVRLAPMFDPACCLGAELQEGNRHLSSRLNAQMICKYMEQCGSGFGDGKRAVPLRVVMEELRSWPEWKAQAPSWVADFGSAMDTFRGFLVTVPSVWLPDHRKRFALELLEARLSWMQSLL